MRLVLHSRRPALAEGESDVVSSPAGYTVVKLTSVDRKSWEDMAVTDELKTSVRNQSARDDMVSYGHGQKLILRFPSKVIQ